MKTFLKAILFVALVFVGALAFGQQPGPSFTVDGVTYYDVHFGEKHGDSVDIFHSTGVRNIPLEKLPPEIQKQLGYRPKKTAVQQAPAQKPAAPKSPVPKTPVQKPPARKPPEQKPAVQKPAVQKTPEQKTSEQKTNIEKLILPKADLPEPAAPKPAVKKTPVQKVPVPETPVQKPAGPATVQKVPVEKPAAQKPAAEKPPVKKTHRPKAPARKATEVPNKIEAEQWLKDNEKKVWVELWSNYDAAAQEANTKYSATSDPDRWRAYQEELWSQRNADFCKPLGITPAMQEGLFEKGYREDWPIEKSAEDKTKISNDAGVKPVSDEADGSVAEVVSYLKVKLGDSNTVEYVRWYPPLLEDTSEDYSWAVEVKYRAKSANGTSVVETGTAYIRHNKVVDFKVKPGG
jgi:hypothetical protein